MRNTSVRLSFRMRQFLASEKGQDLIEYALVVAMLAGAAAAGMTTVAMMINQIFTSIGTRLSTYTS